MVPGPNLSLSPFSQDCPSSTQGEAGISDRFFLGYMYEYFTFARYLSFIEDRVKFNNSGISPAFLLAHLLHLN
jgi:hypothetical protein